MARNYKLTQTGQEVQDDLYKIEDASIEGGTITIGDKSITPLTEETDPTVPAWAKAAEKPSYTADEVGALPDYTTLADLPDDADHRTVSDAEKDAWDAKSDFSGDYPDLTNKPDLSQFITRSVNDLVNYYLKNEVYTKDEVADLLAGITGGIWVSVSVLPQPSADTYGLKIYLVPSQEPATQNQKDEYITTRTGSEGNYSYAWEQIGTTSIDLSEYVTNEDLQDALEDYVSTEAFQQALAGKADKDTDAVEGNFAAFDSSGNPVDSGSKASDFATAAQGAKADTAYQKPSGGIPSSDLESGVIPSVPVTSSLSSKVRYIVPTEPGINGSAFGVSSSRCIVFGDDGKVDIHSANNGKLRYNYNEIALKSDIPSIPVQDVTVGGASVLSGTTAVIPAIPDAVSANPTVPSGTTPTALTGLKIGSNYYDIEAGGGTVTDVTVGGTSVVNASGVAVVPAIPTVEALTTSEIDTIIAAVV